MTNVSLLPTTSMLSLPDSGPISPSQEDDPFNTQLRLLFSQHEEDKRMLALAYAEIAQLERKLADLRAGIGVSVEIEGRHYSLAIGGAPSSNGHSEVADSFVL